MGSSWFADGDVTLPSEGYWRVRVPKAPPGLHWPVKISRLAWLRTDASVLLRSPVSPL